MREVELLLVEQGAGATIYTIHFLSEEESEFERFYHRFKEDSRYNEDFNRILAFVGRIAENGALERYFWREGKFNDGVYALPVIKSKLRLYCLRLSDRILILGNGGVKTTRIYNEDDSLRGFVMTLQNFEKLLREEETSGNVEITIDEIKTDSTFELWKR